MKSSVVGNVKHKRELDEDPDFANERTDPDSALEVRLIGRFFIVDYGPTAACDKRKRPRTVLGLGCVPTSRIISPPTHYTLDLTDHNALKIITIAFSVVALAFFSSRGDPFCSETIDIYNDDGTRTLNN